MNKTTIIFAASIFLLIGAISVTWYIQHRPSGTTTTPVGATYTDFKAILPTTNDGGTVTVDNFLKNPAVAPDTQNQGLYFLGNTFDKEGVGGDSAPSYVVTYEAQSGFFNVTLLKKPFYVSQLAAESYLRDLLKLDNAALCGLSYMVSVPGFVDENASGYDYRFSFCPDSTKVPE
jgi:hypothetical protein